MKSLITATLETLVLIGAIILVFIGSAIFKYENPYNDFKENHPDTVITVGSAMGFVEEGQTVTNEIVAKWFFGAKTQKTVPQKIVEFLNREVGVFKAKVLRVYWAVGIVAGILCLIFGIGFPLEKIRGFSPSEFFDNLFVDKNYVYKNGYGERLGYVGEGRSCFMTLLTWALMLTIALIWGFMLPFFIALNLFISLFLMAIRLLNIAVSNSAAKTKRQRAAGKSGEEVYTIFEEHGLFVVAGDKHPKRALYFNEYWNAVIAQRIMQCDTQNRTYNKDDAVDTIQFGNERLHKKRETSCTLQKLGLCFNSAARKTAEKFQSAVDKRDYHSGYAQRSECMEGYIIKYNRFDNYMLFRVDRNCAFMKIVMKYDSEKTVFDIQHWNVWMPMERVKKLAYIEDIDIEIPSGEDWKW